jgi:CRP-like cAMP-binding protein
MFHQISASIESFGSFPPEKVSLLLDRLKVMQIKKDENLIKEGQICQSIYFINQGSSWILLTGISLYK